MEHKIQELTARLYQEGVEKGETEARKIINEAQEKAAATIADAVAKAERFLADAKQQAAEIKRNTDAEIKLAAVQAIATIKQQIVDLIIAQVVEKNITSLIADPNTLKEFISIMISNWDSGSDSPKLEVLLPVEKQEVLRKSFEQDGARLLQKELVLSFSKDVKAGFRIGPKDGTFKISFTEEDFCEFFKEYLRPRARAYLFGE